MTAEQITPARAEQRRIDAAVTASRLTRTSKIIMWAATDVAAEAAEDGRPFAISLDQLSDLTELTHAEIGRRVADLMQTGWIDRGTDGQWLPTIPAGGPA